MPRLRSNAGDLTRALAFERTLRAAQGLVTPIDGGVLISDPAHPLVWDVNTVWLDDTSGRDAAELISHAERLLAPLGLMHRSVVVADEAQWRRLSPGFSQAGFMLTVHEIMRYERPGPPPAPAVEVGPADPEDLAAAAAAYIASEPWGVDDEAARQVREHTLRRPPGVAERWWTVRRERAVVAYARLWEADGVAQVEDVVVLQPWRRRGFGRAVVATATRAALAGDPDLLFIVADAEDWPRDLYADLGYSPIGRIAFFRRIGP